jgi:hypothetical protein
VQPTRYELIAREHSTRPGDLAARLRDAGNQARLLTPVASAREEAIRDVATGVAAPALIGFVLWMLQQARDQGAKRLRFLSRDGQILYELARRIARRLELDLDMEYVYSSRLTWCLAATDPGRLAEATWLFDSFMSSNATDVCARLGIPAAGLRALMDACGVSADPECRADQPEQRAALQRFLSRAEVAAATAERITEMRRLVIDYAIQRQLACRTTALVDAGWTGRMIGAMVQVAEHAGLQRPHVFLWGHEPRPDGWTDPDRVAAFLYNTATDQGVHLRVPDAPFLVETFCMGDHGVVTGYQRQPDGEITPVLATRSNGRALDWGLTMYRSALYRACDALVGSPSGDIRRLIHDVMAAFWCSPTLPEALAWGAYPYDSDPAGTATRRLARPFEDYDADRTGHRGDRAWIYGSAALSGTNWIDWPAG